MLLEKGLLRSDAASYRTLLTTSVNIPQGEAHMDAYWLARGGTGMMTGCEPLKQADRRILHTQGKMAEDYTMRNWKLYQRTCMGETAKIQFPSQSS